MSIYITICVIYASFSFVIGGIFFAASLYNARRERKRHELRNIVRLAVTAECEQRWPPSAEKKHDPFNLNNNAQGWP